MLRFMIYMRGALGLDGPARHYLEQPHDVAEERSFRRALNRPPAFKPSLFGLNGGNRDADDQRSSPSAI